MVILFAGKKGKGGKPHVELSADEMTEVIDLNKMKAQMEASISKLKQDYAEQLTLRTNIGGQKKKK